MGEKIRNIGEIKLAKSSFIVELNKATFKNGPRYVHIQNDKLRYNLTESDFAELVLQINKSAEKIKRMKRGTHDEL